MSLQNVMETIEGHQFAAEVNLAAGFDAFHRGIENHSLFRDLAVLIKDPGVLKTVLVRLIELSRKPIRTQYENPFDSAMAAYLVAVDAVDPEVAAAAAEAVSKTPNCWWASQVSSGIAISASLPFGRAVCASHENRHARCGCRWRNRPHVCSDTP